MKAFALFFIFNVTFFASFTIAADTLIYNNSNSDFSGFNGYNDGYLEEFIDYGTSPGGRISKFRFAYWTNSSTVGTIWISFYRYTDYYDPGYPVKTFAITNAPATGGSIRTYEYVIPENERFELGSGDFGYSYRVSRSSTYIARASGGQGNEDYFWFYDSWYWDDFVLRYFQTGWSGFYMQVYTAPPIDEVTCDIAGSTFDDADGDGFWDAGEPAMPGWEIYADTNSNNQYDAGVDPNVVTDPNGMYFFENLDAPATYTIREVMVNGWTQTLPGGPSYEYVIEAEPNTLYTGYHFGNTDQPVVKYGGGLGTSGDPYQIETPEHLNEIGLHTDDWNKSFRLEADLDMSGYTGTQYNLIGNATTKFTGSFNGNNHVIRNFSYTTGAATYYVGLFGYTNGAAISGLGLENVNVSSAGRYIGGLAGYQINGTASNCYVTGGQVSGANSSQYVGGLAGFLNGTTVSNCRSNVNVNSGTSSVYVGGFAGRTGNLTNCYSAGAVTSGTGGTAVGGLVGSGGTMTSCYWDMETSGFTTGLGSPKTTEQMQTQSTFSGWNFTTVWRICEGTNYPRLQWEPLPVGDFECPEGVELMDLLVLCDEWLSGALPMSADIAPAGAPDGKVDLLDFALFAENWLVGVE